MTREITEEIFRDIIKTENLFAPQKTDLVELLEQLYPELCEATVVNNVLNEIEK